jgi:ribonuclease-3
MEADLNSLEQILGFTFRDRSLLFQALIHRSYLNENPESQLTSNERLEFLGDAVLDALTAEFLYQKHPEKGEGELTLLRSALVRAETLAELAAQVNLGQFMILGRGEESDGGRTRHSILADAFEALVGAIFLEGGVDLVRKFLSPLLEQISERLQGHPPLDFKSALQIRIQGSKGITPRYRTVKSWGPDHARTFRVEVLVEEQVIGQGEGQSKQAAQQEAARNALEKFKEKGE